MSPSDPQEKIKTMPTQDAPNLVSKADAGVAGRENSKDDAKLSGLAAWVHQHRDATTRPVGHVTYQVIRNCIAAVPYAFATVGTWAGFQKIADVTKPLDDAFRAGTGGRKAYFGSGLRRFANSPMRDIAMIATGFALYRGTLKLVRYTKERLFNPEHSAEETRQAVDHFGSNLAADLREIAPAEANSTPYGAIVLGLGRRFVGAMPEYCKRDSTYKIAPGMDSVFKSSGRWSFGRENWKALFNKTVHPKSMPWSEAAVFIASFLGFFELSDRLFKDTQIRRGLWNGEHNSVARVSPEKEAVRVTEEKAAGLDTQVDYQMAKHGVGQYRKLFEGDPNLGRLMMTRVASTALGIGAYTLTKRAAYASMGHFLTPKSFMGKTAIEGAATATFFVMSTSNDVIEGLYKKWNAPKEKTPLQQKNHEALMARLNAKDQGHVMA